MLFTLLVKHIAEKQLVRLPRKDQSRIWQAIKCLQHDPFVGKKLDGEMEGIFSLRVGAYRVLYEIHKKLVLVVVLAVGHRQGIYK